jgi:hypothetical protein
MALAVSGLRSACFRNRILMRRSVRSRPTPSVFCRDLELWAGWFGEHRHWLPSQKFQSIASLRHRRHRQLDAFKPVRFLGQVGNRTGLNVKLSNLTISHKSYKPNCEVCDIAMSMSVFRAIDSITSHSLQNHAKRSQEWKYRRQVGFGLRIIPSTPLLQNN